MEMVEDESTFVTVIIDEVESLTSARAGAMSGKEPSDALRVSATFYLAFDGLRLSEGRLPTLSKLGRQCSVDTAR